MSNNTCSSNAQGSARLCNCGMIANCFTAGTPYNYGRRFYKCPRSGAASCGFWEWRDTDFSSQAERVIHNLRTSLDVVRQEREDLKKLNDDLIKLKDMEVMKVSKLNEKLQKYRTVLLLSWAVIIGFVLAKFL